MRRCRTRPGDSSTAARASRGSNPGRPCGATCTRSRAPDARARPLSCGRRLLQWSERERDRPAALAMLGAHAVPRGDAATGRLPLHTAAHNPPRRLVRTAPRHTALCPSHRLGGTLADSAGPVAAFVRAALECERGAATAEQAAAPSPSTCGGAGPSASSRAIASTRSTAEGRRCQRATAPSRRGATRRPGLRRSPRAAHSAGAAGAAPAAKGRTS